MKCNLLTSGPSPSSIDCKSHSKGVSCSPGCPNNLSPCQYIEDDGSCTYGYIACLQKMGCGGKAGDADCIGTSVGTLLLHRGFSLSLLISDARLSCVQKVKAVLAVCHVKGIFRGMVMSG